METEYSDERIPGTFTDAVEAVAWKDDGLRLLDQRLLPGTERYLNIQDAAAAAAAIADMVVRGAPAIGIAAAYGCVLAAREAYRSHGAGWRSAVQAPLEQLRRARPTAVNLAWSVDRMGRRFGDIDGDPVPALLAEAGRIHAEDVRANLTMGRLGAEFFDPPATVITHCNTGSLATGGFGTALGVIRSAFAQGKLGAVFAGETRPWLQGARLTAWELHRDAIPVRVIADAAAAYLMQDGRIDWVVVGADRIAANGDVANKIGTYSLAVAAKAHGVRFMVVAPTSTIDLNTASGREIAIEQRPAAELLEFAGNRIAPASVDAWNPVFDLTPADLVSVLVTEKGAVERPREDTITALLKP